MNSEKQQPGVPESEEPLVQPETISSDIEETTEITGGSVPQPMSAQSHVNQPLITPEPFAAPSTEGVNAALSGEAPAAAQAVAAQFEQAQTQAQAQTSYAPPVQEYPQLSPQTHPAAYGVAYPQQGAPAGYGQQSPYYPQQYMQPVPSAPERKSNRLFATMMAVLSSLVYAGFLLGALIVLGIFYFIATNGLSSPVDFMLYPNYYLAVLGFAVVYVLLALLANRASWWVHIFGGYLTGLGAVLGYLGGRMWEDSVWSGAAPTIQELLLNNLFTPTAIIVFILGREIPIWMGAIISGRAHKLKENNEKERAAFAAERENVVAAEGARN
ncbi:MAG: hypothetical protein WBA28_09740 [Microbacteriaceae bacterium]